MRLGVQKSNKFVQFIQVSVSRHKNELMYEIYFLHVVKHTQIHLFDSVCWAGTPGHAKSNS